MVVSMDHGDKTDVHPTIKYPIGHRLALLALSGQYGYRSLEARSPELLSVSWQQAQVLELTFAGTTELRTSDAKELRGFEVLTYDGKTHPLTGSLKGATVTLQLPATLQGKDLWRLRYAWCPYTDANLTGATGLPVSTFSIDLKTDAHDAQ